MSNESYEQRGLISALIDDGRPLITFTGMVLLLSGIAAGFLAATGHFLPHDVAFLGMTPPELCSINQCRIVHFMMHDRVAFGGSLIAIASLYLWLSLFPLRHGESWAWWTLAISGAVGFASFLTYIGYGYLDTWHGFGTLLLLPCFALGLVKYWSRLHPPRHIGLLVSLNMQRVELPRRYWIGRWLLMATAVSLAIGGFIIMSVGMTSVFVPQDLAFMGLSADALHAINPRLTPLIAHDRAGFGGGVCCCGVTMFFCVRNGAPSRSLWQALLITGLAGFGSAIGIHPAIGYTDFLHLAPAYLGALLFIAGLSLTAGTMLRVGATEHVARASTHPTPTPTAGEPAR